MAQVFTDQDLTINEPWSSTHSFRLCKVTHQGKAASLQMFPKAIADNTLRKWQELSFLAPDILGLVAARDVINVKDYIFLDKKNASDVVKQLLTMVAQLQRLKLPATGHLCAANLYVQDTGRLVLAGLTHVGEPFDPNTWSLDEISASSPELVLGAKNKACSESWSAGVALFLALTGAQLNHTNYGSMLDYFVYLRGQLPASDFKDGKFLAPNNKFSNTGFIVDTLARDVPDKDLVSVIVRLLDVSPSRRYTAQKALDKLNPQDNMDEDDKPSSKKQGKRKASSNQLELPQPSTTTTTTTTTTTSTTPIPPISSEIVQVSTSTPATSHPILPSSSSNPNSISTTRASNSIASSTSLTNINIEKLLDRVASCSTLALIPHESFRYLVNLHHIREYPAVSCLKALNALAALASLSALPNLDACKHLSCIDFSEDGSLLYCGFCTLQFTNIPSFKYLASLDALKLAEGSSSPPDRRVFASLSALGALAALADVGSHLEPLRSVFERLGDALKLAFL